MGVQHNFYSQFLPRAIQSTTRLTAADLTGAAANQQEADEWLQLDHNLKYVLVITTTAAAATLCRQYQHEIGLEIYRQLHLRFKTPRENKKHWLPNQASRTNIRQQQLRRIIQQLGIRYSTVRVRQQHNITRPSQSGSSNEQNKRTIAAALTPQCRTVTNVCRDTYNNNRVPKSTHNLQQTTAESIVSSFNKLQRRSSTNGHRSNQQRKVQRKRKRQIQRKERQKGQQRKGLRKLRTPCTRKLQHTINRKRKRKDRTRNALQRTTGQRKRKVLWHIINSLLCFSGIGCLLIVLARITFVAIPRSVSPDAVSLPSQIFGRNLFSNFGRSFTLGSW